MKFLINSIMISKLTSPNFSVSAQPKKNMYTYVTSHIDAIKM
jgi:hypothetical protein